MLSCQVNAILFWVVRIAWLHCRFSSFSYNFFSVKKRNLSSLHHHFWMNAFRDYRPYSLLSGFLSFFRFLFEAEHQFTAEWVVKCIEKGKNILQTVPTSPFTAGRWWILQNTERQQFAFELAPANPFHRIGGSHQSMIITQPLFFPGPPSA